MHRVVAPPDAMTKDGMLPDRYSIPYVSFRYAATLYFFPLLNGLTHVQHLQFCAPVCLSTVSLRISIHG